VNNDLPGVILDSYALLAYFGGETGREIVEDLFDLGINKEVNLYLSLINLGEVLYITERTRGFVAAQSALGFIDQLPLTVLPVTKETVLSAAHIKAHFPLAYGDAFAIASALAYESPILTGDPEFKTVEDRVEIHWLHPVDP
jgi:predicted nucleic acid-binding protein